jgi:D-serine deaminase-like pyridoxal phosphate-dependent protein
MKLQEIDTPALIIDLERMERNISSMSRFFAAQTSKLRPHFKTPKCAEVPRRQLEAEAIGVTCAKLGEAEALADAGVLTSVLIANQIVGPAKVARLAALAERVPELLVAIDDPTQIDAIDAELGKRGASIGALIEVDVGMRRCGTDKPEQTVELAQRVESSRIAYRGMMGYEGHAVLVPDDAERKELAETAVARLLEHRKALVDADLSPEIVSAGGTGTVEITAAAPGVTEIQAGSYVFMDGAYRRVRTDFECALSVLTTVIHRRRRVLITDCGMKALSHEFGLPTGYDLPLTCLGLSEEHGHVGIDEGHELDLSIGDRIRILPSHGDTTINLHERYYAVRGEEVEEIWPIIGRGKFV